MTGKERLIDLLKLLYTQTDEDHPLSTAEIVSYFQSQGVPTDRGTVKADVAALKNCEIEIMDTRGTQIKYYFSDRKFELAELKLLVDAVESSKFITARKSEALVKKLMSFTNVHNAKELERHLYTVGRIKPENESIYYTVDIIHRAINAGKQISFVYCEYTPQKELLPKRSGEPYVFSPYAMLYNEDKYYVLGYSDFHQKIVTFRVDRMKKPDILDIYAVPRPTDFDPVDYTVNVFSMYDGENQKVKLLCRNELMNYVIDRFGEDVPVSKTDRDHFTATVEVSVSQTFFAWVFQFSGGIRIKSPAKVKEQYVQMLENAQN
ncbi:helix-turn-helix transcriptional regulator [Anaerotruncus rubiinfantis]|uniref:helix-turn-helix transcriptional regulator n=1 Tax=Anaerotruncus rubiinfantis TaxID=1720200 RepID=UPI001897542E|nr:WYL domain-containing protein [Anaerotruncus rubiinfantis]